MDRQKEIFGERKICYICKQPILSGQAWGKDEKGYFHWTCKALTPTFAVYGTRGMFAPSPLAEKVEKIMQKAAEKREKAEIFAEAVELPPICPECGKPIDIVNERAVYDPETGRWYHEKCWIKKYIREGGKPPICATCGKPITYEEIDKAVFNPKTGKWYHRECWEKMHGGLIHH
jgi:hypothetical protein